MVLWSVFRGQFWDFGLFGSNHHRFLFDSEVNQWNVLSKLWAKGGYQCQSFGIDCLALIFSFLLVPQPLKHFIEARSFENLTTHRRDSRSSCWLSLRILNFFRCRSMISKLLIWCSTSVNIITIAYWRLKDWMLRCFKYMYHRLNNNNKVYYY